MNNYTDCCLCPRNCHVDRTQGKTGYCGQTDQIRAARAALHMWEEPCISGDAGSGAVFFSGCTLGCVFCQNHSIAAGSVGKTISVERLAEIFLELQEQKAWNINLVTAGHFAPQVAKALELAKNRGLQIPVVYNTSGYEKVETLRMFEGLTDIYLPDFKYLSGELSIPVPIARRSSNGKFIEIKGARQNNLKNVDVDIPRGKLVAFTGRSGSGKTTLAFDTIYAEGYRKYMESLSAEPDPEKRLLRVAIYAQSGFVMLRFENYCAAPVELAPDGLPARSTHGGYDLKGVRAAAQQHDGTMTVKWGNGWFTVRILLPQK